VHAFAERPYMLVGAAVDLHEVLDSGGSSPSTGWLSSPSAACALEVTLLAIVVDGDGIVERVDANAKLRPIETCGPGIR
jgi:hypothetical protein